MAVKKRENTFKILNKVNVSEYTKKKGRFSYLSWCFAVQELLRVCPEATWEVHSFNCSENVLSKQPYMEPGAGCFVQVTVDVDGVKRTQVHPVIDNKNQTIKKPNAFEINTSIQRCLAKAIALHGLGLYIFAGEDLPEADPLTEAQAYELSELASNIKDEDTRNTIYEAINEKQIDSGNFEACKERCNKIIEKEKTNG